MSTLVRLLLALTALAAPPQEAELEPVSEERIEAAVDALTAAFDPADKAPSGVRIDTLLEHGWIDDVRVIAKVAVGLRDKRMEVKVVAIELLGGMSSEKSLTALTKYFQKRFHHLRLEVELWPRIFRAVGRRGDPIGIPTLLTNVRGQMEQATLRARMFGLANIRTKEAVDGIFAVLDDLDEAHRVGLLDDARTALFVLTGQRPEGNAEALQEWWVEARAELVLPAQAPRLEGQEWEAWRMFWQLPRRKPPTPDPTQEG